MAHRRRLHQPLICGYYGEHNLGDDALLEALLQQLPQGCDPLVTAFDQAELWSRWRVRSCSRRSLAAVRAGLRGSDALVLGGGSLLQDGTSFRSLLYYLALILEARLRGKPVFLWGQGLGPLRRRRSRWLVRSVLPLVQGIGWRDAASAALAASWGVSGSLGSDPVWSLRRCPWHGLGGPIVVCWRATPLLQGPAWTPLLEALDALAASQERAVLWLPVHRDQDSGLLEGLRAQGLVPARLLQRSRSVSATDPDQAMALFASAGLVLAMRLHALILGALGGAPVAALSYDPKVRAAAEALGCPCLDLVSTREDVSRPDPSWAAVLDRPPDPLRLEHQRTLARVHADLIGRWFGS